MALKKPVSKPKKMFKKRVFKRKSPRIPKASSTGGFIINRRGITNVVTCSGLATIRVRDQAGNIPDMLYFGTPTKSYPAGVNDGLYDVPFAMQFQLTDVVAYSDLTNIADRFKILKVKIEVHGVNTTGVIGSLTYAGMPWIEYVHDYDNSATPTSISEFSEKMGIKTLGFNQRGSCTLTVRPRCTNYSIGGYAIIPNGQQWIDCSSPQQPHYAIKGLLRNVPLYDVKSLGWTFVPTYTVQVKDIQ